MNSLDIGLAFLEGLALIISPCILPVLPLVLSTSVTGGRMRPYGIIVGFIAAFSAFVLASRQIITALHIAPDVIRNASLVLLLVLGLVMISDRLSKIFSSFTQGLANAGGAIGGGAQGGFFSGILMGALIGLVWTPCAGPILAAVLVQVIRQQTDAQSIFVTLAFAVGASVPMLIITLTGRRLMQKMKFVTAHTEMIRKIFGGLILLSVLLMAYGAQIFTASPDVSTSAISGAQLQNGLEHPYPAPELTGIQNWINSPPLKIADLRGKVVLIDFWTYSCINCVRTLPYITAWDAKYRNQGLVIIGVHAPEFEFEKDLGNIRAAVRKDGIRYPVAVDNDLETWAAYHNQYWPAHYLINKNGQVVYTHFGEGDYDITENNIRFLLGLKESAAGALVAVPISEDQTPETYLGATRAERKSDETPLPLHHWALTDLWKIENDKIVSEKAGASLKLHFKAKKVFLVMGTTSGDPAKVMIKLGGQSPGNQAGADAPGGTAVINRHTLYELVNQTAAKDSELEITAEDKGVELYAFTFGSQ